jgi:hypothetical protein
MKGEKRMTNAMVLNRMDFMELTHDEMMCVDEDIKMIRIWEIY